MVEPIRVMQIMGRMMGGGVEATTLNHYRFLDHDRVQFDFVVQSDSDNVPVEEIERYGGRIFTVPSYKNFTQYNSELHRVFKEEQPDIVHSNMNALSVFPLRAAARANIPIRIAHSHSTSNPNEVAKNMVKNALRPFSKVYPTHLAACGTLSAEWLFGNKAVQNGDVHYIHNAIDLHKFEFNAEKRAEYRASIGVQDNQLVIGQVGRFSAQKNQMFSLDVFREVLNRVPNAVLVFLGIGDTMEEVKQKAVELGMQNHVKFMGLRHDVAAWYSAFDVLLFPSLYEGLPLSLIEAQASGLPIVVSSCVTEEAFINIKLVTVMSLKQSPKQWADAIIQASRSSDLASRCHQITPLQAAGYEIRDSAQALQQWYEDLYKNL